MTDTPNQDGAGETRAEGGQDDPRRTPDQVAFEMDRTIPNPPAADPPPDWRIGLSVKPTGWDDSVGLAIGKIIAILPPGTAGLDDSNGILKIEMPSGVIILRRSADWVLA